MKFFIINLSLYAIVFIGGQVDLKFDKIHQTVINIIFVQIVGFLMILNLHGKHVSGSTISGCENIDGITCMYLSLLLSLLVF